MNDSIKLNKGEKAKLFYMNTQTHRVCTKTDDNYIGIAKDFRILFHTSDYQLNRPLPKGKNRKIIGIMKNGLGEQIIK